MKHFHLNGIIDDDLLNKFYAFWNQYEEDDWTISIFSGGGFTAAGKTIINALNSRQGMVTLICHEAYSVAYEIFYRTKCKKILAETCKGMYHLSSAKMWITANMMASTEEDRVIVKDWKETRSQYIFAKEFMNKKEFKKFKKGDDVYFTFKRMKEIFPDAEVI